MVGMNQRTGPGFPGVLIRLDIFSWHVKALALDLQKHAECTLTQGSLLS